MIIKIGFKEYNVPTGYIEFQKEYFEAESGPNVSPTRRLCACIGLLTAIGGMDFEDHLLNDDDLTVNDLRGYANSAYNQICNDPELIEYRKISSTPHYCPDEEYSGMKID